MKTIIELFEKQLQNSPDKVFVFDESRKLTAKEFNGLADTIAQMLPHGVKRVGIIMEHSVEMIAAIFAVLKVGAAYIPAEPTFPVERINYMLSDADAECVIINKAYSPLVKNLPTISVEQGLKIKTDNKLFPLRYGKLTLHIFYILPALRGNPRALP